MSEIIAPDGRPASEVPPAADPRDPEVAKATEPAPNGKDRTYAFPVIQSPEVLTDERSGMLWVGRPLSRMDPLHAIVALDGAKMTAYEFYARQRRAAMARKQAEQQAAVLRGQMSGKA